MNEEVSPVNDTDDVESIPQNQEEKKEMVSAEVMRGRLIAKERKHKQEMQKMQEELDNVRSQVQQQEPVFVQQQDQPQQMTPQTVNTSPMQEPNFLQQQQATVSLSQEQIADMIKKVREEERMVEQQERNAALQEAQLNKYKERRGELEKMVSQGAESDPEFREALSNAHHIDASVFDHLINEDHAVPVLKKLLSDEKLGKEYSSGDWYAQNSLINRLAKEAAIERALKDNKQYSSPFISTQGSSASVSNPESMSTSEYRKYLKSQGRY